MATTTCLVKVRSHGYTYTARVGVGKAAINASCTSSAEGAAKRAGSRFLRVLEKNVTVKFLPSPGQKLNFGPGVYEVSDIEKGESAQKGGEA